MAIAALGAVGIELVAHEVIPGKHILDELDGACDITVPQLTFGPVGPSVSNTFMSAARQQSVGYTIGYPAGYRPGDELPLVVMLHGFGGNHTNALSGMSPAQAMALKVDGQVVSPMALVTVDGGDGYWNPHPGDDPMSMVMDELIPMCQRLGLGRAPQRVGMMGISMGGYGALLLAEKFPQAIAAVAAISPAVWTSYDQARAVYAGAYASAQDFANSDAVTHVNSLTGISVRVAAGVDDSFYPGVQTLAAALPRGASVYLGKGCHDSNFFTQQEPPSLAFLAQHLVSR